MSGFFSFGFINLSSVNQPFITGPQVQTTLTSGPAFTERQFLEALKYRKPPPPPPRKLTAVEIRQREFERAESAARSLPLYGNEANAEAVRENFKFARQNRDHEYYMEIVNKAWSEFKSKNK